MHTNNHVYHTLNDLLSLIDQPNATCCQQLYADNQAMFDAAAGSKTKHQAWEGGYLDHVRDIMNIAVRLYAELSNLRPLAFSLSDSLLILFLHDLEKPWKYAGNEEQKKEVASFADYQDFIKSKINAYGFMLSDEHWNALKYVHGEGDDYDPQVRVQTPLAAFVHVCDTISARIWFDYPKETGKR
jgi:hypothetical protein